MRTAKTYRFSRTKDVIDFLSASDTWSDAAWLVPQGLTLDNPLHLSVCLSVCVCVYVCGIVSLWVVATV